VDDRLFDWCTHQLVSAPRSGQRHATVPRIERASPLSPLRSTRMLIRIRGALTLVSPAPSASRDGGTPSVAAWMADATFNGPHAGIVRSAFWDEDAGILLSGGEDGTLCAWNCPPLGACNAEMADEGGLGGRGVVREQSEEMDVDSPRAKRGRHDDAQVRLAHVFSFVRGSVDNVAQTGKKLRKL
jgi:hypothetical protein